MDTPQATAPPHNLGTFSSLPAELRVLIWEHLVPCHGNTSSSSNPSPNQFLPNIKDLRILRASRQLNAEITSSLYHSEVLTIHISPIWQNWLTITNIRGAVWKIPDSHHPLLSRFENLPWERLKSIYITIDAPQQKDATETVGLFRHACDLVKLLGNSKGPPVLEISFLDNPGRIWKDGTREARRLSHETVFVHDAISYAFTPFKRLHAVPSVKTNIPTGLRSRWLDSIALRMQCHGPFGYYKGDKRTQYYLDNLVDRAEHGLDRAPGRNADMMRLERFMYWYEDDGQSIRNRDIRRHNSDSRIVANHEERHDYLMSYNPLGLNMLKVRLQIQIPRAERKPNFPLLHQWNQPEFLEYIHESHEQLYELSIFWEKLPANMKIVEKLKLSWSREAWRSYYPDGIPAFVMYRYKWSGYDNPGVDLDNHDVDVFRRRGKALHEEKYRQRVLILSWEKR